MIVNIPKHNYVLAFTCIKPTQLLETRVENSFAVQNIIGNCNQTPNVLKFQKNFFFIYLYKHRSTKKANVGHIQKIKG